MQDAQVEKHHVANILRAPHTREAIGCGMGIEIKRLKNKVKTASIQSEEGQCTGSIRENGR